MSTLKTPLVVVGAGSWGTALALHLARQGNPVRLVGHPISAMQTLHTMRENTAFLPGYPLPDNIEIITHHHWSDIFAQAAAVLLAVPSHIFESILVEIKPYLPSVPLPIIWGSKGLAPSSKLLNTVFVRCMGEAYPYAILSGPSFAQEVAQGLPTAVAFASNHLASLQPLARRFASEHFQLQLSDDVIGVSLGGIIKNVVAIAVGLLEGMNYGANAKSAVITYGLSEMIELGTKLGAKPETLCGLAGLGDMILTCTDNQSRNRRFGTYLGQGNSILQAKERVGQVVEGQHNAAQVMSLFKKHKVAAPVCENLHQVLLGQLSPEQAVRNFLCLPIKS